MGSDCSLWSILAAGAGELLHESVTPVEVCGPNSELSELSDRPLRALALALLEFCKLSDLSH